MRIRMTALSIVLIASATPVWAQEAPADAPQQYEGKFVTVERDVSQQDGVTSGSVSLDTQNGAGVTRTFARGIDEQNQSVSRSAQTVSNAGKTVSGSAIAACDGNGICSTNRGATGPNGQSVTGNRSLSQTDNGYARSGAVTGPQGLSTSSRGTIGYSPESGLERSAQRTGRQGNTLASDRAIDCTGNACNRTASQTGPQGLSRRVDSNTTLGEYGAVRNTRQITTPSGETRTQSRAGRARRRPK